MIVSCPNCFLEQPLDHYCAACGKELRKLINEKNKNISLRTKKTQFTIVFLLLIFLNAVYLYYSNNKTKTHLLPQNSSNEQTQVKLALPKDYIKRRKPDSKTHTVEKIKKPIKQTLKQESFLKNNAPVEEKTPKKIKAFYFLSLQHCNSTPLTGELNNSQYIKLMKCAVIHFKTSNMKIEEILDEAPSFATQFSINLEKNFIKLNFILTTDLYIEEFKHTLALNLKLKSPATIWAATRHNVESIEPPTEDMLASYATLTLFNFSTEEEPFPKLYFLASYK